MFKRAWHFISQIGIAKDYDEEQIKRVGLINQTCFIAFVVMFISGFNSLVLGDNFSFVVLEALAGICLFVFYLNHKSYHAFAISFLLSVVSLAIFYLDSYSGQMSGTYLYYFPLVLAIGFIFDFEKHRYILLFHFGLVFVFSMTNVLTDYELFKSDVFTAAMRHRVFLLNLFFCILSVGFSIYLNSQNNINLSQSYNQRIIEREEAAAIIQKALLEKKVLMAELHHRVKNNLAVIAGLFNLTIDTPIHDEARSVLIESRNRVVSIALIHNLLYKNESLVDIDVETYLNELIAEIQTSYPAVSKQITVNKRLSTLRLNISAAVPCALILNEVLTNCYKHAFVGRESGTIEIDLAVNNDLVKLLIIDDGVGMPPIQNDGHSIGLTVIEALSDQLDAKHNFKNTGNGTCFQLDFKYP